MAVNGFLDWLFYVPFGAPGVAFATSITWLALSLMYSKWLMGNFRLGTTPVRILLQLFLAFLWGGGVFLIANNASLAWGVASMALCVVFVVMHFIVLEKCGLYVALPVDWRPAAVFRFILSKIRVSVEKWVPERTTP